MNCPHIGIFGRRNYGKSSLINFLTNQIVSIVSNTPGTTTDPVRKSMELLGIGPVVWVDTAGIDDTQDDLGRQRVLRSFEALRQCDLALILFTNNTFDSLEKDLVQSCVSLKKPYLLIYSQEDRFTPNPHFLDRIQEEYHKEIFILSTRNSALREPLCKVIKQALPSSTYAPQGLLNDVVSANDIVVLVTPIDSAAPEGRMILPQVQVLRNLMDIHASAVFCQPQELQHTLQSLKNPPRVVITDSQVYDQVSQIVPESIYLTSFSVVLARAKGLFAEYVQGTPTIDNLQDGDRVLLLESCTHNVTCDDIGRVKLPRLISKYTGKNIHCEVVSGLSTLNRPITDYKLVIQCGGCVITQQQLMSRLLPAISAQIPVSNYGLAIAYMNGIFHRSMQIFNNINI